MKMMILTTMASAKDPIATRPVQGKESMIIEHDIYLLFNFYRSRRNYRYNDRASPADVATEAKPSSLNMNIRSKTVSSPVSKQPAPATSKQPPSQKKIDLGAAANFGKPAPGGAAGIHSPTHRDTPTSVDLMGAGSPASASKANNNNNTQSNSNDLLDDLFKTCSPTPQKQSEKTLNPGAVTDDDDDFNPREGDAGQQDFGDFASAFGGSTTEPPSTGLVPASNDEFADFTAFQGSATTSSGLDANLLTTATPANDSFDLFNSAPAAGTTSPGATTATDLLAGLGDLSIHQSMPMGELPFAIVSQYIVLGPRIRLTLEYRVFRVRLYLGIAA